MTTAALALQNGGLGQKICEDTQTFLFLSAHILYLFYSAQMLHETGRLDLRKLSSSDK